MTVSEQSQLVFYGEILPGHDADVVRLKLGELLKLPAEQIPAVFSGRRVILRKGLSSEQGTSYVARLEKLGVRTFVEPVPVAVSVVTPPAAQTDSLPESTPVPSAVVAAAVKPSLQAVVVEEMDCPKCGERQPRRTLCRACAVDMKRFSEAQQAAEQQVREERQLAREIAMIERRQGARGGASDDEPTGIWGLGLSGRTGRINYCVGGLPVLAVMAISVWLALKTGVMAIGILGILLTLYLLMRLTVLRCHDLNWSGWFGLITCIPYVGALFGLILGFMPGTPGDNNHGSPSRRVGVPAALGMLVACGISVALMMSQAGSAVQTYLMASAGQGVSKPGNERVLTVAEADVEMFTTSDCGVCHMAKAYMNRRGITYAEKDVEKNEEYLRDFYARGGRGVPYIFVGSQSMMGFDPDRLEQMLAANRT